MDLKCDPDLMDFRFKFDDLIGSENNVDHTTGGCPAKSTDGLTDIPTVQDTNFMWRYELGFCDSEVTRTTDETRVLELLLRNSKKSHFYYSNFIIVWITTLTQAELLIAYTGRRSS